MIQRVETGKNKDGQRINALTNAGRVRGVKINKLP
jgi:hypothetical protein